MQAVEALIAPSLTDLGYEVVRVTMMGVELSTLQVMAERLDEDAMTVEDCASISRTVSAILDVEDPISGSYLLEVSSPGIDRPLTRLTDYERFQGELVKITLRLMQDGRRRFTGRLGGVSDAGLVILDTSFGKFEFAFNDIEAGRIDPSEILERYGSASADR